MSLIALQCFLKGEFVLGNAEVRLSVSQEIEDEIGNIKGKQN